jgi:hypothetical protein
MIQEETKKFDIEIDFENYTVPEERALEIRAEVAAIKTKSWLANLSDWVAAVGSVYLPYGEQAALPGAEIGTPQKRIAWEEGHVLKDLEIICDDIESEVRIGGQKFVSLQRLPKGEDFIVSHYNTELLLKFNELETELHEQLKTYLKAKSEKQKAFQDRFKKSDKT